MLALILLIATYLFFGSLLSFHNFIPYPQMPSLRVHDATEPLINLNAHCDYNNIEGSSPPDLLIEAARILQPFGHGIDVDFDAVDHYIEVPEKEDLSGTSISTSSQTRLGSYDTEHPETRSSGSSRIITSDKRRSAKRNAKSGIWQFFEIYKDLKLHNLAYCLLCKVDVNYSTTMSTGMLTRHVRTKYRNEYQNMLEEEISKKLRADPASNSVGNVKVQSSIEKYVEFNSTFEAKLTHWIVQTYQPFTACEHPCFREMCRSLNMKAPNIGVYKIKSLLSKETACLRVKLQSILQGANVSITKGAWTSCNNVTYITCTAHFCGSKDLDASSLSFRSFQEVRHLTCRGCGENCRGYLTEL